MWLFGQLRWYFKAQWRRYAVAMILLTLVALLNLIPPWITGRLVDAVAQGTLDSARLLQQVGIIVVVVLPNVRSHRLGRACGRRRSSRRQRRRRRRLLKHIRLALVRPRPR